jgi:hypothetical protein
MSFFPDTPLKVLGMCVVGGMIALTGWIVMMYLDFQRLLFRFQGDRTKVKIDKMDILDRCSSFRLCVWFSGIVALLSLVVYVLLSWKGAW